MKKIFAASLIALSVSAYSQNLNQTVRITNAYKSGVENEEKQTVRMSLPDSLTKFNYKFDYSVFDAPYKGAFEFSPYTVMMTPDVSDAGTRKLFVRAGAGYGLYPQLQAVWTPVMSDKVELNLHQDFNGYYGKYRTFRRKLSSYPMYTTKGERYDGYDFSELFGVDGKFSASAFNASFGLDYNGIFNKDECINNNFNSVLVNAGLECRDAASAPFYYAATLKLDFASDVLSHPFQDENIRQTDIDLAVTLGPRISDKFDFMVDARVKPVFYGNTIRFANSYFGYAVAPHLQFVLGPVRLSAGVKLDGAEKFHIAPDVRAYAMLFDNRVKLFAEVTGGTDFNTYAEFKRYCHWYCPAYSSTMVNSFERVKAQLGVQGSVAGHLQYSLSGGWTSVADMPMWAVVNTQNDLQALLSFRGCNFAFADLSLAWKSSRIDADGNLHFKKSNLGGVAEVFDLPLLAGDLKFTYNWSRRIFAGLSLNAATSRKSVVEGCELFMDGYFDLGISGEYRINSMLSVWLKGGNLLNQTIQLSPMHAEAGINCTAGVCFSL